MADAGDEVDERESGRESRRISREVVGNNRPGPMEREDSDVISFERGAKPMRAGILQATARK